jgi:hypothetical protein
MPLYRLAIFFLFFFFGVLIVLSGEALGVGGECMLTLEPGALRIGTTGTRLSRRKRLFTAPALYNLRGINIYMISLFTKSVSTGFFATRIYHGAAAAAALRRPSEVLIVINTS